MTRPPQLDGHTLVPSLDVLLERLGGVEEQIAGLEAKLQTPLDPREQAGVYAHLASLSRRKRWYLTRIRTMRPAQVLDVEVGEDIHTAGEVG